MGQRLRHNSFWFNVELKGACSIASRKISRGTNMIVHIYLRKSVHPILPQSTVFVTGYLISTEKQTSLNEQVFNSPQQLKSILSENLFKGSRVVPSQYTSTPLDTSINEIYFRFFYPLRSFGYFKKMFIKILQSLLRYTMSIHKPCGHGRGLVRVSQMST